MTVGFFDERVRNYFISMSKMFIILEKIGYGRIIYWMKRRRFRINRNVDWYQLNGEIDWHNDVISMSNFDEYFLYISMVLDDRSWALLLDKLMSSKVEHFPDIDVDNELIKDERKWWSSVHNDNDNDSDNNDDVAVLYHWNSMVVLLLLLTEVDETSTTTTRRMITNCWMTLIRFSMKMIFWNGNWNSSNELDRKFTGRNSINHAWWSSSKEWQILFLLHLPLIFIWLMTTPTNIPRTTHRWLLVFMMSNRLVSQPSLRDYIIDEILSMSTINIVLHVYDLRHSSVADSFLIVRISIETKSSLIIWYDWSLICMFNLICVFQTSPKKQTHPKSLFVFLFFWNRSDTQ